MYCICYNVMYCYIPLSSRMFYQGLSNSENVYMVTFELDILFTDFISTIITLDYKSKGAV